MLWSTATTKEQWYFWLMEMELEIEMEMEIIFLQKWKVRIEFN